MYSSKITRSLIKSRIKQPLPSRLPSLLQNIYPGRRGYDCKRWSSSSSSPDMSYTFANRSFRKNTSKDGVYEVYGFPLPWWLLAIQTVVGMGSAAYYLKNVNFEELTRKASTSAWGTQIQLKAMMELVEWQEFGPVTTVPFDHFLVKAGLLRCISSGIRSDDAQVRISAWTLASGLSVKGSAAMRLLTADETYLGTSSSIKHDGNNGGSDVPNHGKDKLLSSNGLWNVLIGEFYGIAKDPNDKVMQALKSSGGLGRITFSQQENMDEEKEVKTPPSILQRLFGQSSSSKTTSSDLSTTTNNGSVGSNDDDTEGGQYSFPQEVNLGGLSILQTLANLTEPKRTGLFNMKSGFTTDNNKVYGKAESVASDLGCDLQDPRIVFRLVELLTMIHPDYLENQDHMKGVRPSPEMLIPKVSIPMPSFVESDGGQQDGLLDDILVEAMISEMDLLLVEILHNLVATDKSGLVCEYLSAKKPIALLRYLSLSEDESVTHLTDLTLRAVLTSIVDKLEKRGNKNMSTMNSGEVKGNEEVEDLFQTTLQANNSQSYQERKYALKSMEREWVPLFNKPTVTQSGSSSRQKNESSVSNRRSVSSDDDNTVVSLKQAKEVNMLYIDKDNRDFLSNVAENIFELTYTGGSLNYRACNQIDMSFNSMILASIYAPIRRWLLWRINGEDKLVAQLRTLAGSSRAVSTYSLRQVLTKSALRNACGALVLSFFSNHGDIENLMKYWEAPEDFDRSDAYPFIYGSSVLLSRLVILGSVLRFAPYCVLPTFATFVMFD